MSLKTDIIKASCKGDKGKNIPNQDYISIKETDEMLIASVCDGLGSAKHSLEGGKIACKVVEDWLKKNTEIEKIQDQCSSISIEWNKIIETKPGKIEEYRTANSFVAIMKSQQKIVAGLLGDVIISIRIDDEIKFLGKSDKDFLNETECLGSGNNEQYKIFSFNFINNLDFIIATDGIGDELLEDNIEALHVYLLKKYKKIAVSKRNMTLKKEIVRFLNEKNNDDKSLVFVWGEKK